MLWKLCTPIVWPFILHNFIWLPNFIKSHGPWLDVSHLLWIVVFRIRASPGMGWIGLSEYGRWRGRDGSTCPWLPNTLAVHTGKTRQRRKKKQKVSPHVDRMNVARSGYSFLSSLPCCISNSSSSKTSSSSSSQPSFYFGCSYSSSFLLWFCCRCTMHPWQVWFNAARQRIQEEVDEDEQILG